MDMAFCVFDGRLTEVGCRVLLVVVRWRVPFKVNVHIFWSLYLILWHAYFFGGTTKKVEVCPVTLGRCLMFSMRF
jgi:hypothetical protein